MSDVTNARSSPPTVRLWMVDLAQSGAALTQLEHTRPRLSPADDARFADHAHNPHRAAQRHAHIALRIALEHAVGPDVAGQPFIVGPQGQRRLPVHLNGAFSLAHTGAFALMGWTSTGRIGVDLEQRRTVRLKGPRRTVIEQAGQGLASSASPSERVDDPDVAFLKGWVRLEALAKVDGRGLAALFTHLGVSSGVVPSQAACTMAARRYAAARAVTVHDLDVGPDRFAAAALPDSARVPTLSWLEF